MPILQAAQVGKTVGSALVNDGILKDPARAGRVGADGWMHILWQAAADLLKIFDYARTRPIRIGSIFEDDKDIGVSKHCLRAHRLHVRRSQEASDNRISDLIFDDIRRLAFPTRMDDDLNI